MADTVGSVPACSNSLGYSFQILVQKGHLLSLLMYQTLPPAVTQHSNSHGRMLHSHDVQRVVMLYRG